VGPNTVATVLSASSTQVTFLSPALVAGVYDLSVFAPDGSSSVLPAGLTYYDPTVDGSQPGSGNPGGDTAPAPANGSQPGGSGPGASDPGATDPGGSQPGSSAPGSGSAAIAGPHRERLMPSALFAGLGATIWGVNCGNGCSGLAV
jgi:hypothetical protein